MMSYCVLIVYYRRDQAARPGVYVRHDIAVTYQRHCTNLILLMITRAYI